MRNTGYHISEGTIKTLNAIHAQGIDPVELAEILKEGIENGRIVVLPSRDPSAWAGQLRAQHQIIEDYTLTAAEREEKAKARMEEMRKRFAAAGDGKDAPPPPMWEIPEGGEPFGLARADIEWVDPNKKKK